MLFGLGQGGPVELPDESDLEFLRSGLPVEFQAKNISYHPESDSIPRFEAAADVKQRVERILRTHGQRVEAFLRRSTPDFVPGWTLGTTSFRSIEEQGRNLKPRSSNELVHIDAGAYGATNGARILRFFVNIHPSRDRVWGTKGSFNALMSRHRELIGQPRRVKEILCRTATDLGREPRFQGAGIVDVLRAIQSV